MLAACVWVCCPSPVVPVVVWHRQACWSRRLVGKGSQSLGIFGPVPSRTCSQAVPQTCLHIPVVQRSQLLWSSSTRSFLMLGAAQTTEELQPLPRLPRCCTRAAADRRGRQADRIKRAV